MSNTKADLQAELASNAELIENLVTQIKDLEREAAARGIHDNTTDPTIVLAERFVSSFMVLIDKSMSLNHELQKALIAADPQAFVAYQAQRNQASVESLNICVSAYPDILKQVSEIATKYVPVIHQPEIPGLVN